MLQCILPNIKHSSYLNQALEIRVKFSGLKYINIYNIKQVRLFIMLQIKEK